MFILLAQFISLARLSSSSFSPDRVFRRSLSAIIARPLGRPQTTIRRRISPFLSFSVTFIAAIAHIQPELRFFQTHSLLFLIPPGLLLANKWPPMFLTGPPFYCRRQTLFNLCILLLLIIGGVGVNTGPSSSVNLTFGSLNTRSVVDKAPLLHGLIVDNDLSLLDQTETWVKSDDPPPPSDQKWPITTRLSNSTYSQRKPWPDQGRVVHGSLFLDPTRPDPTRRNVDPRVATCPAFCVIVPHSANFPAFRKYFLRDAICPAILLSRKFNIIVK